MRSQGGDVEQKRNITQVVVHGVHEQMRQAGVVMGDSFACIHDPSPHPPRPLPPPPSLFHLYFICICICICICILSWDYRKDWLG